MSKVDASAEKSLHRVSMATRAASLAKWLLARPEERAGCLAIGRCGGTYQFAGWLPIVSPTITIRIRGPSFNDRDMEHLRSFHGLLAADFGDTSITEDGVSCLSTCSALRYLFLWGTQVSDRVVEVLERMPELDMLNLSETCITRDAFNALRHSLPNTFLTHSKFGDFYLEFYGEAASTQWLQRDEPRV